MIGRSWGNPLRALGYVDEMWITGARDVEKGEKGVMSMRNMRLVLLAVLLGLVVWVSWLSRG